MSFKYGTRVYEALNKYIERTFGHPNDKIMFYYNTIKINRNEPKTVEEFFDFTNCAAVIQVWGC